MRASQLFFPTLREAPAEAEGAGHRLLVRAGFIRPVAAGVFAYLPLGGRTLRKVEQIVREEMDAAGGQEVYLPALQPAEVWQATGRWDEYGELLFKLRDRKQAAFALGPTHEEVFTQLVARELRSYRQLPLRLYQIQTKFRDELRPRGGLLRLREFQGMDLYSFDADEAGLEASYQRMVQACERILERCALPFDVHLLLLDEKKTVGAGLRASPLQAAEQLCTAFEQQGLEVLFDDRAERPGTKFHDADLIGLPVQVVVGRKWEQAGAVEVRARGAAAAAEVPLAEAVRVVEELIGR